MHAGRQVGYAQRLDLSGRTDRVEQLAHISLVDGLGNTALGLEAGQYVGAAGRNNAFVGAFAGASLAGSNNAVVGAQAAQHAREVSDTVLVGQGAGRLMANVVGTVMVGSRAGATATKGAFNTGVGYAAGAAMLSGARNVFVGSYAGHYVREATDNVFVGDSAGKNVRYGDGNVFLGSRAGAGASQAANTVIVGTAAGTSSGSDNVVLGTGAASGADPLEQSVVIGYGTGKDAKNCVRSVLIGTKGAQFAQDATDMVAIGMGAGAYSDASQSIFVGTMAGENSSGQMNTFLGTASGQNAKGNSNVVIGESAAQHVVSENSCFAGLEAGDRATGDDMIAIGRQAGRKSRGDGNIFLGERAGEETSGDNNVGIGQFSGRSTFATAGSMNVSVGYRAGYQFKGNSSVLFGSLTGYMGALENTVAIGPSAAYRAGTCQNSVFVGANVGPSIAAQQTVILGSNVFASIEGTALQDSVFVGCNTDVSSEDIKQDCVILRTSKTCPLRSNATYTKVLAPKSGYVTLGAADNDEGQFGNDRTLPIISAYSGVVNIASEMLYPSTPNPAWISPLTVGLNGAIVKNTFGVVSKTQQTSQDGVYFSFYDDTVQRPFPSSSFKQDSSIFTASVVAPDDTAQNDIRIDKDTVSLVARRGTGTTAPYTTVEVHKDYVGAVVGDGQTNMILHVNAQGVGVGLADQTHLLHLASGDAYKPDGGPWLGGSDARVKTNIRPADLDECVRVVRSIPLRRFEWASPVAETVRDKRVLGWVAQEVEPLLPKAVVTARQHGLPDFKCLDSDQILKVMYGALQRALDDIDDLKRRLGVSGP